MKSTDISLAMIGLVILLVLAMIPKVGFGQIEASGVSNLKIQKKGCSHDYKLGINE